MTEEEKASSVMISLDVPEGFTISRDDGAMVEGPADLVLIVKAEAMKMSEPLTNQPSLFHSIGEM